MGRPFKTSEAKLTKSALSWRSGTGELRRLSRGVYTDAIEPEWARHKDLEKALAIVVATDGVASGTLAGVLHDLDSVFLRAPFATVSTTTGNRRAGVKRMDLTTEVVNVKGYPCTNGLQTLIDIAPKMSDLTWEHAMECAIYRELVAVAEIEAEMERLRPQRVAGMQRIRRVMALRPPGAPPTESYLETLMVQLIRSEPRLPTPERQVEVRNEWGDFVARVDLAWPDRGIFIELDGQHHLLQPVYDASRETAVVATTGWRPGRFTWDELHHGPAMVLRRLVQIHQRATG